MEAGRLRGRIKSFNSEKGFGFIECQEMYDKYGRDVFIHRKQLGDFEVGMDITFFCDANKEGMPQAREPETLDGRRPGPGRPGEGGGDNGGKGGGKGGGKDGGGKGKGGKDKGKGKGGGKDKGKGGKDKGKGGKDKGGKDGKKGIKIPWN